MSYFSASGHKENFAVCLTMRTHNFTIEDVEHFAKYFARLEYDAHAARSLHFQCSSFYWADERPDSVDDGYDASLNHFMLYALSYRRMLMYEQDVPVFVPLWNRLKELCPNWPGFRTERRAPELIPELEQQIDQAVDRMERILAVHKRRLAHRARLANKASLDTKDSGCSPP